MWIKDYDGNLLNLDYVVKIYKVHRANPERSIPLEAKLVDGSTVAIADEHEGQLEEKIAILEDMLKAGDLNG